MNISISLYHRTTGNRIFEYPIESSNPIKLYLESHSTDSSSSLITARKNNLMYYAYDFKLNNDAYFGVQIGMNGVYVTELQYLKDFFEEVISQTIKSGIIQPNIRWSPARSIETLKLADEKYVVMSFANSNGWTFPPSLSNKIIQEARAKINSLPYRPLPPLDYGVINEKIAIKSFKNQWMIQPQAGDTNVLEATIKHSLVIIRTQSVIREHIRFANMACKKTDELNINHIVKLRLKMFKYRKFLFIALVALTIAIIIIYKTTD